MTWKHIAGLLIATVVVVVAILARVPSESLTVAVGFASAVAGGIIGSMVPSRGGGSIVGPTALLLASGLAFGACKTTSPVPDKPTGVVQCAEKRWNDTQYAKLALVNDVLVHGLTDLSLDDWKGWAITEVQRLLPTLGADAWWVVACALGWHADSSLRAEQSNPFDNVSHAKRVRAVELMRVLELHPIGVTQ